MCLMRLAKPANGGRLLLDLVLLGEMWRLLTSWRM